MESSQLKINSLHVSWTILEIERFPEIYWQLLTMNVSEKEL